MWRVIIAVNFPIKATGKKKPEKKVVVGDDGSGGWADGDGDSVGFPVVVVVVVGTP